MTSPEDQSKIVRFETESMEHDPYTILTEAQDELERISAEIDELKATEANTEEAERKILEELAPSMDQAMINFGNAWEAFKATLQKPE